jgi:hypothetical protein
MAKEDAPMRFLLLLFIAMPIIEMWLLISVGAEIGALATIGLVLATALIGAACCERYWALAANCDVEIDEIVSFG